MKEQGPGYSVSALGEPVFESGTDPPDVLPGDLVRIRDGPPELVYCWPRGEWGLWVSELEARHGDAIAVVLDPPKLVDRKYGEVDLDFGAQVDLVVDPSPWPANRVSVRVLMPDGWVGHVWLSALDILNIPESRVSRDVK